jgi:hypothetical protein
MDCPASFAKCTRFTVVTRVIVDLVGSDVSNTVSSEKFLELVGTDVSETFMPCREIHWLCDIG